MGAYSDAGHYGRMRRGRSRALSVFIRQNRAELDAAIRRACPNVGTLNDRDRELWVLNDAGLYAWAREWGWRG